MRIATGVILALVVALSIATVSRDSPSSAWGGQFLEFTGPGSGRLEVPHDPALNPASAITIEAWVYLRSYNAIGSGCEPTIVGKDYPTAYWLGVGCDGSLRFYTHGSASSLDGNTPLPLDTWVHVAVTYDGTTQRHFINGALDFESAAAPGALTASGGSFRIGSDVSWDYSPDGYIDEVRLWNVARPQADIAATMNTTITAPEPGLVAVWNLDGDSLDPVGSFHGMIGGDAQFTASTSPGPTPGPATDTPTPTAPPTPGVFPKGDMDCDGDVDAVDSLRILRHVAALGNTLPPGCDAVGT